MYQHLLFYPLLWLGRHASKVLPAGLFIGLLIPPLAQWFSHLLAPAMIIPLSIALARIDWQQQFDYLKRWPLMLTLASWVLIGCPVIVWTLLSFVPIPEQLNTAAVMAAAAPPVTACAAIALFLGLDAAITVVVIVLTMIVVPLILPPLALELLAIQINISLIELSLRLGAYIFTAFIIAAAIKRFMGTEKINQHKQLMDAIAVIFITVFIIGIMDGVSDVIIDNPAYAITTTITAFGLVIFLQILSGVIFWRLPRKTCLAIAMMCGNCNLGLMYLVLADQASIDLLIFYSLGQIPMYVLPAIQTPLYKWLLKY
jgi:BASS family bile acid:Na+ symporter